MRVLSEVIHGGLCDILHEERQTVEMFAAQRGIIGGLERDSVFYLNDVKGEPPRLESGRVAALSIHQPFSIFIVSLFIPSAPLNVPIPRVCVSFALSVSLYRMERAESSAWNSRIRMGRSLCEYYSALHSRFFRRVMLHRDVPLHLRAKGVDTILFLHWLFST